MCVLVPFVSDPAPAPIETVQPDPDRAVPPRIGQVLGLLGKLITYGKNLADTLRQHAPDPLLLPCFAFVASVFGTADPALILARITRGLLRAAALEARLSQRAARGRDLRPSAIRMPSAREPRATDEPAALPATLARTPAQHSDPARLPTAEEIAAEVRRRPIGAVLVDICHDLGIVPGQMNRASWDELCREIIEYGGNLAALVSGRQPCRHPGDPAPISRRNVRPSFIFNPIPHIERPVFRLPEWPAPPATTGPP